MTNRQNWLPRAKSILIRSSVLAGLVLTPATALASQQDPAGTSQESDVLFERIEQMEAELAQLRERLEQAEAQAAQAQATAEARPPVVTVPPMSEPSRGLWRPSVSDVAVQFGGYADVSAAISDSASNGDVSFSAGSFNPLLLVQYRDLLLFEGEAELEIGSNGETELALEYTQLDIFLHDNATLVVGKFLSPVGQFQERLHPSWINRLADAPAGFGHDGVQPASEVGVQLRGGVPLGSSRLTYAAAIGNGPRLNGAGAVMAEGFGGDDNGNKAISGRIGFLPTPYMEVGASALFSRVNGPSGEEPVDDHASTNARTIQSVTGDAELGDLSAYAVDYNLWGVDAAYTRGPWDVRFEYLRGVRDAISVPGHDGDDPEEALERLRMTAWYGQVAYRLTGLTDDPVLGNFEPVIRYGEFNVSGLEELAEEAAEQRWDVGLNYWFAPSVVLHTALQYREFTDRHSDEVTDDLRLLFKVSYGF